MLKKEVSKLPTPFRIGLLFVLAFFILGLFSTEGVLNFFVLKQEITRLKNENLELEKEKVRLFNEISLFDQSPVFRQRKLRELLGVLTEDELSFEFFEFEKKVAK